MLKVAHQQTVAGEHSCPFHDVWALRELLEQQRQQRAV